MLNILKKKPKTMYIGIFGLIILTVLTIEIINKRFWLNDFKVMYYAANAFLNNEQVYGVSFGLSTGFYKYSPFTLLLFIPYNLLSYKIASIIHFLIIGYCAIGTTLLLKKIVAPNSSKGYLLLLILVLFGLNHLIRDLHLGNVNMILVFVLCLSLYLSKINKNFISGLLLALAIITKPYFAILLLPYYLHKKIKVVFASVLSILGMVITSFSIIGLKKGVVLYQNWFSAMLNHNNYLSSSNTIYSLIQTYFNVVIDNKYGIISLGLIGIITSLILLAYSKQNHNYSLENAKNLSIHFFF